MKDDIKEILDKLKSNDYYEKEYQKSIYYNRDLKKLEDYITNLQKSQETLIKNDNEIITNLQEEIQKKKEYIKYLEDKGTAVKGKIFYGDAREVLQERIDKAIEYIKEDIEGNYFKRYEDEVYKMCDDLLSILQGEDNE